MLSVSTRTVANARLRQLITAPPDSLVVQPAPDEVELRLEGHRAILAALGVTDLSALGTLTVAGNVVPSPGLLAPAPSVTIAHDLTTFQSSFRLTGRASATRAKAVRPARLVS